MAQHIFTGSGAPATTPTKVGQHYIDTANKVSYVSAGTASSADWKKQVDDTHAHTASDVSDFDTEVSNTASVTANTAKVTYPSADSTKLSGIETAATADQTGAEIKSSYEAEADTNAFTNTKSSKLDGIETSADVTDAANVASAGAVMESDTTTASMGFVVDEDNMVSDSATKVPSQQSVKKYVDDKVVSSVDYRGGYNAATNTPDLDTSPSGVTKGDMYTVTVTGTFFTTTLEIGDVLIAEVNSASAESDWTVVQKDMDAASIKTSYESNADTNEFSDAEQTKLTGIATSATANDTDTNLKARANHTGTQTKSTISDFSHTHSEHTADTLANLNAKVSDATLIDTGDSRLSDDRTASGIKTATTTVSVSSATAPTTGQILKATSTTTATWQNESGGNSVKEIAYSYGTTAGDFIEGTGSVTYQNMDSFCYKGSDIMGVPTSIEALISSTTNDNYVYRIYDITNSQVIAQGTGSGDVSTKAHYDFGTVSNVPTGMAIWELQFKEDPSSNGKARCHSLNIGI